MSVVGSQEVSVPCSKESLRRSLDLSDSSEEDVLVPAFFNLTGALRSAVKVSCFLMSLFRFSFEGSSLKYSNGERTTIHHPPCFQNSRFCATSTHNFAHVRSELELSHSNGHLHAASDHSQWLEGDFNGGGAVSGNDTCRTLREPHPSSLHHGLTTSRLHGEIWMRIVYFYLILEVNWNIAIERDLLGDPA